METLLDWSCTWIAGPDAGGRYDLQSARHVVGRARTAAIRCDDPLLLPHHAVLDLGIDGSISLTTLTDAPHECSGRPCGTGMELEVGASVLRIERRTSPTAPSGDATIAVVAGVAGALVRSPRAVPTWQPIELGALPEPPTRPDPPGGLVPALLGLAGAGLIALVLRQPMFVIFGALGAMVGVGSWVAQRIAGRRTFRRRCAAFEAATTARAVVAAEDRAHFVHWHLERVPTLADARADVDGLTRRLWSRRLDQEDARVVSVGIGPLASPQGSAAQTASSTGDLPVPTQLSAGDRLAITGPAAMSAARSLVAQLTASCGPADLRIVVVTDRPTAWDDVRELPHLASSDGTPAIVDEAGLTTMLESLAGTDRVHIVVVTDLAAALATRTSPLRRFVGDDRVALLAVLGADRGVPHICTAILATDATPIGQWVADTTTTATPTPIRVVGLGERAMRRHATTLGRLHDPEDALSANGRLPRTVALGSVFAAASAPSTVDDVVARWSAQQGRHVAPSTPIGQAVDGLVDLDLVRDGPHGLIAGTTGAGKSELLRTLVIGLAMHVSPAHLAIVLVDYKGGATFDGLRRLPHVVGVVTDLDADLGDRVLRSLHAELRRREGVLRTHGASDLVDLHAIASDAALPRLLVVIDEFAAMSAEQPEFLHALVGIAQRGRSLGVHLLLATQRPHGVISDDIRANTNLRIALRLHDTADAVDVVGDAAPAHLPRTAPGRAVMRLGADELVTFQTAHVERDESAALVEVVVAAAQRMGLGGPAAPWLPPLPATVCHDDLEAGALGVCDDPDHQTRRPLRWTPSDGSLVVAGGADSGLSSTLITLARSALADAHAHVYVITSVPSSGAAALAAHPRCIVVHLGERERLLRVLHRLRATGASERTVLVIDTLDATRKALDQTDTAEEFDLLDEVVANPAVVLVVGANRPSAVPAVISARCGLRWVLHLHDPHDAGALGVAARHVPPAIPGRVFVHPLGLTAQLLEPLRAPLDARDTPGEVSPIPAIDVVPTRVDSTCLPGARHIGDVDELPLGIDFATGSAFVLELPDGDHLLVAGGSRTGRSTALSRIAHAWRDAHPEGQVVAVLPRRTSFDRTLADVMPDVGALHVSDGVRTLVVCDDAELIDDRDGLLAAIAGGRHPGVTLAVSGRADALRQAYGHWTAVVRRSRVGLIATGGSDADGDLLGAALPRRLPVPTRPGLMWVVTNGEVRLVQIAGDASRPPPERTAADHSASLRR